jgi:hypothetical protein
MLKQCLENIGEGLLHACISSTELMRKQIVRSHDALHAHSLTFKVLSFRRTTFFELAI